MLAVAKVYENILFTELSKILHLTTSDQTLDPMRVQKIAAGMITEGRLHASIDQTEGLLEFKPQDELTGKNGGVEGSSGASEHFAAPSFEVLCQEKKIRNICKELSNFEDIVTDV